MNPLFFWNQIGTKNEKKNHSLAAKHPVSEPSEHVPSGIGGELPSREAENKQVEIGTFDPKKVIAGNELCESLLNSKNLCKSLIEKI